MAVWLFYEINILLSKAQKPKLQLTWRALGPDPSHQPIYLSATLRHQRWRRNAGTPRQSREQSFISQTAKKIYVSVWVTPGWYLDKISKALLDSQRAWYVSIEIEFLGVGWSSCLSSWGWDVNCLRQSHTPNSTLSILSSELTSPLDLVLAAWSCRHASLRSVALLYFPRLTFSWALHCCYLSNPHIFPRQRTS